MERDGQQETEPFKIQEPLPHQGGLPHQRPTAANLPLWWVKTLAQRPKLVRAGPMAARVITSIRRETLVQTVPLLFFSKRDALTCRQ